MRFTKDDVDALITLIEKLEKTRTSKSCYYWENPTTGRRRLRNCLIEAYERIDHLVYERSRLRTLKTLENDEIDRLLDEREKTVDLSREFRIRYNVLSDYRKKLLKEQKEMEIERQRRLSQLKNQL